MIIPLSRRQRRIEVAVVILAMLAIAAAMAWCIFSAGGCGDPPSVSTISPREDGCRQDLAADLTGDHLVRSSSHRPGGAGAREPGKAALAGHFLPAGGRSPGVMVGEGLWAKICQVESGGNPHAYVAAEDAAGIAQIRPCVLEDLWRLGLGRFTPDDRWDPAKSRQIFNLYVGHYGARARDAVGRAATDEDLARIWNGGPDGWRTAWWTDARGRRRPPAKTDGYWQRVRKKLDI